MTGQIPCGGALSPVGHLARSSPWSRILQKPNRPSGRQGAPSSQHSDAPLYRLTARSAPAHTYSREGRVASGGCRGGFPGGSRSAYGPWPSPSPLIPSHSSRLSQSTSLSSLSRTANSTGCLSYIWECVCFQATILLCSTHLFHLLTILFSKRLFLIYSPSLLYSHFFQGPS